MNQSELVQTIFDNFNGELPKAMITAVLDAEFDAVRDALANNGIAKIKLGVFKTAKKGARAERQGRNPSTGEAITIEAQPATIVAKVTPAKELREAAASVSMQKFAAKRKK